MFEPEFAFEERAMMDGAPPPPMPMAMDAGPMRRGGQRMEKNARGGAAVP